MKYDFLITGIPLNEIQHIFSLSENERIVNGITKITVDEKPGYPCRVSLEDANIGEEIFAFNYEHHKANSPYRSSGPVFVRLEATEANLRKNEVPEILKHRYLSLRVYNNIGMMIDATTVQGKDLDQMIQKLFSNEKAEYIHVHNAKPGCYNCQINRF